MKLVELHWIDSSSSSGWDELKPARADTMHVRTVGFIVHEDKDTITISSHVVRSERFCHSPLTIPKCAIKKRWEPK